MLRKFYIAALACIGNAAHAEADLEVSYYRASGNQAVIFQFSNYEQDEVFCSYVKVEARYVSQDGELGVRVVRLNNVWISPGAREFREEAGRDIIEQLAEQFTNPSIESFQGALQKSCSIGRHSILAAGFAESVAAYSLEPVTGGGTRVYGSSLGGADYRSAVAISPNGWYAAAAGSTGAIAVLRGRDGQALQPLPGHQAPVRSLAFSPDSQTLASAGHDGTLKLWNLADGVERRTLVAPAARTPVRAVAFSPNGKLLASGGEDGLIRIWSAASGNLIGELAGHGDWINALAFAPNGLFLVSAAENGEVKTWDVNELRLLRDVRQAGWPAQALAVARDGKTVAVAIYGRSVELWNALTSTLERTLTADRMDSTVTVAFSGNGKRVLAGGVDGVIVWNALTGARLTTFWPGFETLALVPSPIPLN